MSLDHLYILDGKKAIKCDNAIQWGMWRWENPDECRVALTELEGATVSTVFLGVDHNFLRLHGSDPLLFETLVFYEDGECGMMGRYSIWEEAEQGHADIVEAVKLEIGRAGRSAYEFFAALQGRLAAHD